MCTRTQSLCHLPHPAEVIKHGLANLFPLPLTFKPSLCAHTHTHAITQLRSCGSTFNAPNYLGPHSSGCCITSGLAGCIFSSVMPVALSPSLSVDWVTTLLLKEPNGRLLKLPSSNHNRSNHCAVPQTSRKTTAIRFWRWVATRKLWNRGRWGCVDGNRDQPGCAFMLCHRLHGGHACWLWGHFYRMWSVVNPWAPNVNVSCSAVLPDTRNYKVARGKLWAELWKYIQGYFLFCSCFSRSLFLP